MAKLTKDPIKQFAATLAAAAPKGFEVEMVSFPNVPTLPGVVALDKRRALDNPVYAGLIPAIVWELTPVEALLQWKTGPYEPRACFRLLADAFLHRAGKASDDGPLGRDALTLFMILETWSSELEEDVARCGDEAPAKLSPLGEPGFYRSDARFMLDFYFVIRDQLAVEMLDNLRAFFALPGLPWLAGPLTQRHDEGSIKGGMIAE